MFIKCWLQFTGAKPQSPWVHAKHHIVLFANADQLTMAEIFETRTVQGTKTHQQKLGTTTNNNGLEFGRAIFFHRTAGNWIIVFCFNQLILDSWQAFDEVKRDALHETLTIGFTFGITTYHNQSGEIFGKYGPSGQTRLLYWCWQPRCHPCHPYVDHSWWLVTYTVFVHIFPNDLKSRISLGQITFQWYQFQNHLA